jgi:hypothetical protein
MLIAATIFFICAKEVLTYELVPVELITPLGIRKLKQYLY